MYKFLVKETMGSLKTTYQGNTIDWGKKWQRVDYVEAFKKETGIDLDQEVTEGELQEYAKKHHIPVEKKAGFGRLVDSIYKRTVRPKLIQPTFLINHPVSVSPLAKRMESHPKRVERMQILVGGTEAGNGFSELNDPIDQLNRFKEQQKLRKAGDAEAQMLDMDYVEALEYGMPPAAGFGLSQRVFAIITDQPIRNTVFFPPMKDEK
jgi:lysyl-tRNA synthetase class 2